MIEEITRLEAENRELRRKLENRPKLSAAEATVIRRLARNAKATHQELADAFGVNRSTITRIINRFYYKG